MSPSAAGRPGDGIVRVLLVEGNPGDAMLVEQRLQQTQAASFHTVRAESLEEAVDRVAEAAPHVALLDLGLPDSHGLGTLTRFRSAAPDLPVVVLTGYGDMETALKALDEGADDYLLKQPMDAALLGRALLYAIEHRSVRRRFSRLRDQVRSILERVGEPVAIVDDEGIVEFLNPAARDRFEGAMPEIGSRIEVDPDPEAGTATFHVPGGPSGTAAMTPLEQEQPSYVLVIAPTARTGDDARRHETV